MYIFLRKVRKRLLNNKIGCQFTKRIGRSLYRIIFDTMKKLAAYLMNPFDTVGACRRVQSSFTRLRQGYGGKA